MCILKVNSHFITTWALFSLAVVHISANNIVHTMLIQIWKRNQTLQHGRWVVNKTSGYVNFFGSENRTVDTHFLCAQHFLCNGRLWPVYVSQEANLKLYVTSRCSHVSKTMMSTVTDNKQQSYEPKFLSSLLLFSVVRRQKEPQTTPRSQVSRQLSVKQRPHLPPLRRQTMRKAALQRCSISLYLQYILIFSLGTLRGPWRDYLFSL